MKITHFIICIIISALAGYSAAHFSYPSNMEESYQKSEETVYDRVMRTGVIRCSYVVYSPTIMKDPNTKQLSGIIYDLMNEMAKKLNLKVEWTEELTWATYTQSISYDRSDVFCGPGWSLPNETRVAEVVGPIFFSGIGVWVRPGDERFNNDLNAINSPEVKISALDGSIAADLQRDYFPKAKLLSAPQTTDYSFNALNVANKKADVTFIEVYQGNEYSAANPEQIVNIRQHEPFQLYPNVLLVKKGEFEFQSMLQNILNNMRRNGEVDKIIDKYEKYPSSFYRVAKEYIAH